jgi:hypothetical protein
MNIQSYAYPLKPTLSQSDYKGRKNPPVAILSQRELRRIVADIIG